jgi:hypothetical protein
MVLVQRPMELNTIYTVEVVIGEIILSPDCHGHGRGCAKTETVRRRRVLMLHKLGL